MLVTVRQNRFLPISAKTMSGLAKGDSVYFYVKDATLCSFWDKIHKPVVILSRQHGVQRNKENGKPDIVEFYNSTKSGVENLDKLVRSYPSKRNCRRWPYGVVVAIFEACVIAAHILWNTTTNKNERHYELKKQLACLRNVFTSMPKKNTDTKFT